MAAPSVFTVRLGILLALVGCGPPPRGQVVVYLRRDRPVPRLADTLRIERLDEDGRATETRSDFVSDPQDWPVSFGVAATAGRTRVRIRLFPSTHLTTGAPTGDGGVAAGAGEP